MRRVAKERREVVVIGGGTGTYTVLSGLKEYPSLRLSAIVSMMDDGGSSGVLRDELGILPPGDIRRSLVALSASERALRELFNYRFANGTGLSGHSFGNLFLAALEDILGGFEKAVAAASRILRVRGRVIPVTLEKTRLCARLENGTIIEGETNIDIPKHDGAQRIEEVFLQPAVKGYQEALSVLKEAHTIIIGPGDLYTSIIPNFLVAGIADALCSSRACVIYISNIMTKFGETNGFDTHDFVVALERYIGSGRIDVVLYNTQKPSPRRLQKYANAGSEFVAFHPPGQQTKTPRYIGAQFVTHRGLIRHDQTLLAKALIPLIEKKV